METNTFDRLTRALSGHHTRRAALAGAIGSALGLSGVITTDARKRKKKKKKPRKITPPPVSPPPVVSPPPPPAAPACGAGGPCLVFLSSSLHTGNLGGLSGADSICQNLATAAGLPGTYKAWLSDGTGSVSSRFVPSTGPYRLMNGATIAANFAELTDGSLLAPIDVTETGGNRGITTLVWTATAPNGTAHTSFTCTNWTTRNPETAGGLGTSNKADAEWTADDPASCQLAAHLYCFQQR